jgi:hypothetical protein
MPSARLTSKIKKRIFWISLTLVILLSSCQKTSSSQESQGESVDMTEVYPNSFGGEPASFALVQRDKSQRWTIDIPYFASYPQNRGFIFVKYVVGEDLYGRMEKGKVVLLPVGLTLPETEDGAGTSSLSASALSAASSSSSGVAIGSADPSGNVSKRDQARYYFTLYSKFLVYLKNCQPSASETYLGKLDLREYGGSSADLDELRKGVDFVARPTYLGQDLDLLPFNYNNPDVLDIAGFYSAFYRIGSDQYPVFYGRYESVTACFKDGTDTFDTIKSRLKP